MHMPTGNQAAMHSLKSDCVDTHNKQLLATNVELSTSLWLRFHCSFELCIDQKGNCCARLQTVQSDQLPYVANLVNWF